MTRQAPLHSTSPHPHHPAVAHEIARAEDLQVRIADAVTRFAGSMPFVYAHVVAFAAWMLLVEGSPWPTLTLVVSLEAIFLSTFVMIGQNRQAAFQRAKADHDFQAQEMELHQNTLMTQVIERHVPRDPRERRDRARAPATGSVLHAVSRPGGRVHTGEAHRGGMAARLNWLRAGVLGANDGVVSTAGLVVGVAGTTSSRGAIFTAGLAGLVAGAVSMALGEYVSVSSQRDSETAQIAAERTELATLPEEELAELAAIYEAKGLHPDTALTVATELTAHDALAAHAEAELHLDPGALTSAWQAAAASALAFTLGALLPLVAILLAPSSAQVPVTVVAVLLALAVTGTLSAAIGGSRVHVAVARVVVGGAVGLALTYVIGRAFGSAVA